jgi:hypothetical protein
MSNELSKREAEEKYGPLPYDLGAGVAKFRRKAAQAGSVTAMFPWDRHAYADAIEKAIRAKHRTLHTKPTTKETGGWYSPPSITRLSRYENPIPMAGDPDWTPKCDCLRHHRKCKCDKWGAREQAVYAAMVGTK